MKTVTHPLVTTKAGQSLSFEYEITDRYGNPLNLTEGAHAEWRLARKVGLPAIIFKVKDFGIEISGSMVKVNFNTNEIVHAGKQLTGNFEDQLFIEQEGVEGCVCEGRIYVGDIIRRS